MSGDYSRISFDPELDFSGVLLQQGRVHLDSEWNELVAQIGRRFQAGTLDILGRAIVPRETPEGFEILATAGKLTIGPGRIYVDGLLAENHGAAPAAWNPVLAEPSGTAAVDYEQQPYVKKVTPLPDGGPHLVYLDVWQREVSHHQEPRLIEKALGIDTSLRLQTVWQVKVLPKLAAGVDCSTPFDKIPNWPHKPSAGQLTTDTGAPAEDNNPCLVPTAAGYKGLENQLYRVEIHTSGGAGQATFKWSRENASVVSRIDAIPVLDRLQVDTIGRDPGLRFSDGDWVEITDDWRELNNEPGELRRIKPAGGVDGPTHTIFLESPLTAGAFPTDAQGKTVAARHTRIRRWDQAGIVRDTLGNVFGNVAASGGAIPVPPAATTLVLEQGITVNFSLESKGEQFRAGDYWVFAARTATASIDKLVKARPRGIHHHYCKLAIVTFPDTESDCRVLWPPAGDDCACTVCVSPVDHAAGQPSLQGAIDKVTAAGGGTICLEVGAYDLKEPLRIQKASSLKMVGKGTESVLRPAGTAIEISENSSDIVLERFAVQIRTADPIGSAIVVKSASQVSLEHLQIQIETGLPTGKDAFAAIVLSAALAGVTIRNNVVKAAFGIVGRPDKASGGPGIVDLRIEDNQFACRTSAINLGNVSVHQHVSRIAGNRITECESAAIELTGATVPGFGMEIVANEFKVQGDGIVAGIDGLRILDNDLTTLKPFSSEQRGIHLVRGLTGERLDDAHIVGNRILGFGTGISTIVPLGVVSIQRNRIADAITGLEVNESVLDTLTIEGNQMSNVLRTAIRIDVAVGRVAVRGNQLEIQAGDPGVMILCRQGDCLYAENHSRHLKPVGGADVQLTANTLIVSSNRVLGRATMSLQPTKLFCTVLGNITGADILVNGGPLPTPWIPLNHQNF